MEVDVILTDKNQSNIIKNLYPLYLYDLSGHYGNYPNRYGIYEDSDEFTTLSDQYDVQSIWWEKPNCLYPFVIMVDQRPAGFILIATPPHCAKGIDYFVNDFFLLQPYRGQGIAESAAIKVFDQFIGNWELFTNPSERNVIGQKFWRKTINKYIVGKFFEESGETFDGYKLVFRFDNKES